MRRSLELGPAGTLLTCCHGLTYTEAQHFQSGVAGIHTTVLECMSGVLTVLKGPAAAKALTGPHTALQSFYLLTRKAAPSSTQHPHAAASEQLVFWNLSTCGKCTLSGSLSLIVFFPSPYGPGPILMQDADLRPSVYP